MPAVQIPVAQSAVLLQPCPTPQAWQAGPPQSMPVSRSFRTPSLHVGHAVATPLLNVSLLLAAVRLWTSLLPLAVR